MTTANTEVKAKLSAEEEAQLFMALLSTDMDEIDRVSMGFVTLPDGSYLLSNIKAKVVPDRLRISIVGEVGAVVELAKPAEVEDGGAKFVGERYGENFNKAFGVQRFRTIFEAVMLALGTRDPSAAVQALNGTSLLITVGHRVDRDDKSKIYNEIRAVVLAD